MYNHHNIYYSRHFPYSRRKGKNNKEAEKLCQTLNANNSGGGEKTKMQRESNFCIEIKLS